MSKALGGGTCIVIGNLGICRADEYCCVLGLVLVVIYMYEYSCDLSEASLSYFLKWARRPLLGSWSTRADASISMQIYRARVRDGPTLGYPLTEPRLRFLLRKRGASIAGRSYNPTQRMARLHPANYSGQLSAHRTKNTVRLLEVYNGRVPYVWGDAIDGKRVET